MVDGLRAGGALGAGSEGVAVCTEIDTPGDEALDHGEGGQRGGEGCGQVDGAAGELEDGGGGGGGNDCFV